MSKPDNKKIKTNQLPDIRAGISSPANSNNPNPSTKKQTTPNKNNKNRKKRRGLLAWQYAKELWADHRFWKQLTVVKGGIGIIAAGALLVPTIASMPLLVGASAVAASGVLVAAALFSVGYGAVGLWNTLRNTKHKVKNTFNNKAGLSKSEQKENIPLSDTRIAFKNMLLKKWPFKQMANTKLAKAIGNSGPWKKFSKFMQESDNLLDTLTVKNSAASIVIFGGVLLTTQAVMIPFFLPIAVAAYSVASIGLAAYMMYEGARGVVSSIKESRKKRQQTQSSDKSLDAKNNARKPMADKKNAFSEDQKAKLKSEFKQKSKIDDKPKKKQKTKAANENIASVPNGRVKKKVNKP